MSQKHAPRGPIKAKAGTGHLMSGANPMSIQCRAQSKQKGKQCGRTAIPGGAVCRYHGGAAPQVKKAARERLMELQDPAINALAWLVAQDQFPSAAYAAARDILDRTEGKPVETVNNQHSGGMVIRVEQPD